MTCSRTGKRPKHTKTTSISFPSTWTRRSRPCTLSVSHITGLIVVKYDTSNLTEITIAQNLRRGTIPVQPLPSRNIVARLRQVVRLCARLFANALRSPNLAHLKQNEREPHNQEMYTVPNTVDTTRWGKAYTRCTEVAYMVPGARRRFWASESDDPRSHFVFRKISPDFVGLRIVRIWDFTLPLL